MTAGTLGANLKTKMNQLPDFYCSACHEKVMTVTDDFTSPCCWEPLQLITGADVTPEMIFEFLDWLSDRS